MRILIISNNAVSKVRNNGKTISSLFASLAPNNIAQLCFGIDEYLDESLCSNFYRITEFDILKSILLLSYNSVNIHRKSVSYKANSKIRLNNLFVQFIRKYSKTLALFRELIWSLRTWDTKELNQWIIKFNPDIIFSVLGPCIFAHKIVNILSTRYNIPYVSYFTDDYVINNNSTNLFQQIHHYYLSKIYKKTIARSSLCYAIGELMRNDYSQKYSKTFNCIVNFVDFSMFNKMSKNNIDCEKEIVISYIGGIHLNRWKSILKLGDIINQISREKELRIFIYVFTTRQPEKYILDQFAKLNIYYGGALTEEQVFSQINRSHFLLHVESFDHLNRLYVKYSISTKIPECLASKRGIIVYGPHEIASIRIFSDNQLGCCLTDLDTDDNIREKIYEYILNYNDNSFSREYQFALDHFDREKESMKIFQELATLTNRK